MGEGEKKVIKEIQYEKKKKYRPKCGHIAHSSGVYVTLASNDHHKLYSIEADRPCLESHCYPAHRKATSST